MLAQLHCAQTSQSSLDGLCPQARAASLPRLAPSRVAGVGWSLQLRTFLTHSSGERAQLLAWQTMEAPRPHAPCPPCAQGLALVQLEFPESAASELIFTFSDCQKVTSSEACCAGCRAVFLVVGTTPPKPHPKWRNLLKES